jgi:hypothetical protein
MAGLLGDFDERIMNPLFLGGAALLSGEGFGGAMQGMQMGSGFQNQKRRLAEQQQQQQAFQGLLADPSVTGAVSPPMLRIAEMAGPQAGPEMLGKWIDPAREADLTYKKAQIEKLRREASDAGTTYGKSGSVFQGADGKFYSVQFGGDGSRVILPVEVPGAPGQAPAPQGGAGRFAPGIGAASGQPQPPMPLTPARGTEVVGDTRYDEATGRPIGNVGDAITRGERAKAVGKGQGEGQLGLPKAETALRDYEIKNGVVNDAIDVALQQTGPWTSGFVGNAGSFIAGTPAHDLSKTLVTIKANLGFDSLQQMRDNSPTGGALGQVTEKELELLQSAWISVEQSQSEGQLRSNLNKLKQIRQQYAQLKREAYERDVRMFGAQNVPNPDGGGAALQGRGDGPFVQPSKMDLGNGFSLEFE